jgi:hypothetical protein
MSTEGYVVIRLTPAMRLLVRDGDLDGRWYGRALIAEHERPDRGDVSLGPGIVATRTDRIEVRDDGAVAQVWEVRP